MSQAHAYSDADDDHQAPRPAAAGCSGGLRLTRSATNPHGMPTLYAAASSRRRSMDIVVPGRSTPTSCLIDLTMDAAGSQVILVVEDKANRGLSVTNAAEAVYAAVAKHPMLMRSPGHAVRVWECYDPASGYPWRDAHVDEVIIRPGGSASWAPIWQARSPGPIVAPRDVPALITFGFLHPQCLDAYPLAQRN